MPSNSNYAHNPHAYALMARTTRTSHTTSTHKPHNQHTKHTRHKGAGAGAHTPGAGGPACLLFHPPPGSFETP